MTRRLTLFPILLLTAALFVACGGSSNGSDDDTGSDTAVDDATDLATDGADDTGGDDLVDQVEGDTTDTVAVGGCSADDLVACEYPLLGVDYTERSGVSIEDSVTGRTLPLRVRVPEGPGPFPAVIWSHGGGFNDTGHLLGNEWGDTLARHGFAVIHVAHVMLDLETGQRVCELAAVPDPECNTSGGEEDADGLRAVVSAYDLSAVLEALPMLSDASVANGGAALDLERVAVAGWSGGARGPAVLFGSEVLPTVSAPRFTLVDDRAIAAVLFSPTGPGFGGYFDNGGGDDSWAGMRGPVLVATGVNDVKPLKPELDGPTRRTAFDLQPDDGTRWLLYSKLELGIGGHGTYNLEDYGSSDERLDRYSRALRSATLAFLDAHLRDDAEARGWLESDNAAILAGEVDWLNP